MITIAGITFYILSIAVAWYWGRNFENLNSVSDIGIAYDNAAKKVEEIKASVVAEVQSLEAKAAELKARL